MLMWTIGRLCRSCASSIS